MFVYLTRQSRNIFRSIRLQTRKRMWMFGPATWICLPGNGWKEQRPWMSQLSQMAGRGPTYYPLTGMDKGWFSWRRPLLGSDQPRGTLGASVMAASAAVLFLAHSRHRTVTPLESKDKQMAVSSSLSFWGGCCWNSFQGKGKLRLREA